MRASAASAACVALTPRTLDSHGSPLTAPFLCGHHDCSFCGCERGGTSRLLPRKRLSDGYKRLLLAHDRHLEEPADDEAGEAEQEELPAAAGVAWRNEKIQIQTDLQVRHGDPEERPCARVQVGYETTVTLSFA